MRDTNTYLKNYQKPMFEVKRVDLDFDLYEDHALITNSMQLKRLKDVPLYLHGDNLELVSITLDEGLLTSTQYKLQEDGLIIDKCPVDFSLKIITRIYPQKNTELLGLFRTKQLFCTQCEAEGFRRISFFLDRPDVLTTYRTRITADETKYPVLLSNGNPIDSGKLDSGRHWKLWEDPFKKPSYLFAMVAGDLVCVKDEFTTASGKNVALHIYVEHGLEDSCEHAIKSLKKAMRWDEEVFGREYDLSIFMIVAVSDFNMGAMENKGLNIFNSKYILARKETATDEDFMHIESVVAHEYFHNWTGNRVTCRDWFQLSLKEGLTVFRDQEFSRDMNSRDVNRIMDVKVMRSIQFPEDAGSLAHPVRPSSYQEINNFYTATIYDKGAEVIRMQRALLGEKGFRKGMDLYFQRHDGMSVTIDDFVKAMEDANHVDFTQFKRWYTQAGTPEIRVSTDYKNNELILTFVQSCRPTSECANKEPFHIPINIALFDKHSKSRPLKTEILELKDVKQSFHFSDVASLPVISLLRDFSAPVKLVFEQSPEELTDILRLETNGYAKWDACQRLMKSCINNYVNLQNEQIPEDLLSALSEVIQDESLDYGLRAEILTPPGFEEIASSFTMANVAVVEQARDFFRANLGMNLFAQLQEMYSRLWQEEDSSMVSKSYGRRKLRNISLWLMMKADETKALSICQEQFLKAGVMSDQLSAFALLTNCKEVGIRQGARDSFYKQWSGNELVVCKWFSILSSCELQGTLSSVKDLLNHTEFSFKNPNKVRAVLATFSQANPRNFHAIDGSGYAFLTDMIIKIDAINPQLAAKLATPFTRFCCFDKERQVLLRKQLIKLAAINLSRDLQEVVSKSLVTEVA